MGNVIDNIMRMKDISELMVDLAYSAVFLQDKAISDQVLELSTRIGKIENETLKHIFRVKGSDNERVKLINFMDYVTDITNAAVQMAQFAAKGEVPDSLQHVLKTTDERVITAEVDEDSILCSKTLEAVKLGTRTHANVISIRRGDQWIFEIDKHTSLQKGDFLVATGNEWAAKMLERVASGKLKKL